MRRSGRPGADEAGALYWRYIEIAAGDDAVGLLRAQQEAARPFLAGITEEGSQFRYAPGKWNVREVVQHAADAERIFAGRALWFARGFPNPLPSFGDSPNTPAEARSIAWADQRSNFDAVRSASIELFRLLPAEAWERRGVASGAVLSVRAAAFFIAGHWAHHERMLRERYLSG